MNNEIIQIYHNPVFPQVRLVAYQMDDGQVLLNAEYNDPDGGWEDTSPDSEVGRIAEETLDDYVREAFGTPMTKTM